MNTTTQQIDTTPTSAPAWPVLGALGAATGAVLTAVGTFWDITGNESGSATRDDLYGWLIDLGIIAVGTALVFGVVVRTATPATAGRRGLVLGVVGVLSVAVFWSGLPSVLAAGAGACALVDRSSGRLGRMSQVALVLSVITLGGAIWLAIAG